MEEEAGLTQREQEAYMEEEAGLLRETKEASHEAGTRGDLLVHPPNHAK